MKKPIRVRSKKPVYWTLFRYGGNLTICSKHRTRKAAEREAGRCEASGGARHEIAEVRFLTRKVTP